jgi:membrane protein DedA with SNARE-associated domain
MSASTTPGTIGVRAAGAYSTVGSLTLPIALLLAALCAVAGSAMRYPERTRAALARARGFATASGWPAKVRWWR